MDNIILTEAFKELKLLEEEAFDIDSPTGIDDAKEYLEDEIVDDTLDVADVYAEEEEEVLDSYIGQVVLDCNVCHSKIFEDPDKVEIDEESQTANMEEECPYCFSMDGYKVIGQVAPMGQVEEEIEVTEEEPVEDIETEVPEEEVTEDEIVEESFRRKRRGKKINESKRTRKSRKINEAKSEPTKADILDWLAEHDQAYDDAEKFFKGNLTGTSIENLKAWISEHNQLAGDFEDHFNCSLEESLDECGEFKKGECRNDALKEGDSCPECGKNPCECEKDLEEDFKDVSITTDDSHMTMTSDEDGKVTVTTEPIKDEIEDEFVEDEIDNGEEMLAPVDDETVAEIKDEVVDEPLEDEEPIEDEVEDIDIDEFDEEGFDELGESYLKKVYENVNSFKTTGIKEIKNKLCIEGLINFKSGNTKKTSFLFEAKDVDSKGKIRFIGENKEITRGKKSFTVAGRMRGKKFMCESLNYNYRAKDEKGKSTRLYGTIKRA